MSNFSFLDNCNGLKGLKGYCEDAENFALSHPNLSAISARNAIEFLIKYIYKAKGGQNYNEKSLFELISSAEIQQFIKDPQVVSSLHYIRILGNNAAHNKKITTGESLLCLENLYFFIAETLTSLGIIDFYPSFESIELPKDAKEKVVLSESTEIDAGSETDKLISSSIKGKELNTSELPVYFTEKTTRQIYIDTRLREAGWELTQKDNVVSALKAGTEIEVNGMPTDSGIGYCDYVLYGKDGLPLAIVEAKKTIEDTSVGRHQAELYGRCMKEQYGYTPILYYTNGYEYWIIDGLYQDRTVSGFHNADELELLLQQRNRGELSLDKVDENIIDRPYQQQAVASIANHFSKKNRRGLLVMATGTGKTRVSAAIVDLLTKNEWVKNVLFLADRIALVKQAFNAFNSLLPDMTFCILSEDKKPDYNARIMFSTYQTMINYIDVEDKKFGIGRFDLIIIDEAHRSIFNKYSAIFEYFDSLIVGLTATPRNEVDANTYKVFGCESGIPNFEYDLETAVKEHYLVSFKEPIARTTTILSKGIKYKDLSEEEKRKYEEAELYKDYDDEVSPTEINKAVFNTTTIDFVIQKLMSDGLKINGGDTLGKSIIFAANHEHAKLIVERFRALYPEKSADYCQLIDNKVKYAVSLIDDFKIPNNDFRIAVSVDMLDTGIDIPELLNLVFFKDIQSHIKFWQMIGRGTRLCPNLFGEGKDKDGFLVFDWCGLFNYFSVPENTNEDKLDSLSLSQKIFIKRLEVLKLLQCADNQDIDFNRQYYFDLKKILMDTINDLRSHSYRILIRNQLTILDKYSHESEWDDISNVKEAEIIKCIAPLIEEDDSPFLVKSFDYKMLLIEYDYLNGDTFVDKPPRPVVQVRKTCSHLLSKSTVPMVHEKVPQLRKLSSDEFWSSPSLEQLEYFRKELRDLMILIDSGETRKYITDFSDIVEEVELDIDYSKFSIHTYKEKVCDYLLSNQETNPVLYKIKTLQKLDSYDFAELEEIMWNQLGSKDDYNREINIDETQNKSLAAFARSIIDLDQKAVESIVYKYIADLNLNEQQIEFIRNIVMFVDSNGDIELNDLIEKYPFTSVSPTKLFEDDISVVTGLVEELHNLIAEA